MRGECGDVGAGFINNGGIGMVDVMVVIVVVLMVISAAEEMG